MNGVTEKLVPYADWASTWLSPHHTRPGAGWFAIFNRDGVNPRDIVADAATLGIPPESRLCDIWNRRERGDLRTPPRPTLPPDEMLFVRYAEEGVRNT